MKLIEEWKSAWRMFSVQAMALSGVINAAWLALPPTLVAHLPASAVQWVSLVSAALGIAGRVVAQEFGTAAEKNPAKE
jgi:hypothetical protein